MLSKSLELGSCGVQWAPPDGTPTEHTDSSLVIEEDNGLRWHMKLTPVSFAIGTGEEAAVSEDLHASARDLFELHWRQKPRGTHAQPRTADPEWSPIVDAKLGRIGDGRIARVVRRLAYEQGDERVVGHLIVPVAKGTIDIRVEARSGETGAREAAVKARLEGETPEQATFDRRDIDPYFPDHPLTRIRDALDQALDRLEIVSPPERKEEVALPEAGCALVPPLRFLPIAATAGSGLSVLVRAGLDDWKRMIDVWRIGRHKLKGSNLHAALVEHADKAVAGWSRDGCEAIESVGAAIDDFGVCLQIEQYVTFRHAGLDRHVLHRWWVAGDGTLWRIGSNASMTVEREALQQDLAQVQETFRRI